MEERIAYWNEGLPTRRWSEALLNKIARYDLSPVRAARAIALLHVAMYDATVANWEARHFYNLPSPVQAGTDLQLLTKVPITPSYPSEHAAVAEAAATVLSYLFPLDAKEFQRFAHEAGESRLYAGANFPSDIKAGRALGARVGELVVHRGKTDGSNQMYSITIPAGPGFWKPQPGIMADPTAGSWRPWVLANGSDVPLPPPPPPGSKEFRKDIDAIVSAVKNLTEEQRRIAAYWADGPGTVTPAGHWIQIAEEHVARFYADDPVQASRALALVSISMADAFIACWEGKYRYWTARPNQVIPELKPYIKTPPFPGYPSGHSTISGAASEVLAALFPKKAREFRKMAEEAAISRLYGGIHFPSDNNNGLRLGREIGQRVLEYSNQAARTD